MSTHCPSSRLHNISLFFLSSLFFSRCFPKKRNDLHAHQTTLRAPSGLEADQKVIAAHGCYALTATTALTAQNTTGVAAIHAVPPAFLRQQLDAVLGDMGADVVKTGMLASADTIHAVADALFGDDKRRPSGGGGGDGGGGVGGGDKEGDRPRPLALVVDPVMVATTGAELLPRAAVRALRERLLPRARVVTPNVPEARRLLADAAGDGEDGGKGDDDDVPVRVESAADLEAVAVRLLALGPEWVLVKGGHVPLRRRDGRLARTAAEREVVVDVLVGRGGERVRIETSWAESRNTHGTGCSLACGFLSLSLCVYVCVPPVPTY